MIKKNSPFQTLHRVLNTSSETFMLVALISLFALPFVIASNLEPIVKESEAIARITPRQQFTPTTQENLALQTVDVEPTEEVKLSSQVLGVQDVAPKISVSEELDQLKLFTKATPVLTDTSYDLTLQVKNKLFDKTSLFKLSNTSEKDQAYSLKVEKGTTDSKANKYLSLDFQEYLIGSKQMPSTITLKPGQEMWVGLKSNQSKLVVDLKISIAFSENN